MITQDPRTKEAVDVAIASLKEGPVVKVVYENDEKKDHMLTILFNRCVATTHLCMYCSIQKECKEYRTILTKE